MLDMYCEPLDKIKTGGISFANLVSLAHCTGAEVEAFHASHSSIDDFRKCIMECSTSDDCHVISSYHRKALKQVCVLVFLTFFRGFSNFDIIGNAITF
jgi:glutathione gamma-glutamylcysteinyltransferase